MAFSSLTSSCERPVSALMGCLLTLSVSSGASNFRQSTLRVPVVLLGRSKRMRLSCVLALPIVSFFREDPLDIYLTVLGCILKFEHCGCGNSKLSVSGSIWRECEMRKRQSSPGLVWRLIAGTGPAFQTTCTSRANISVLPSGEISFDRHVWGAEAANCQSFLPVLLWWSGL